MTHSNSGLFTSNQNGENRNNCPCDKFEDNRKYRKFVKSTFNPVGIAEGDMFVSRDDIDPKLGGSHSIQELVLDSVEGDDRQVFLHGDSGVGKTNLIEHAISEAGLSKQTINVQPGQTFEDIINSVLNKLGERFLTVEMQIEKSKDKKLGYTTPKFLDLVGKLSAGIENGDAIKNVLAPISQGKLELLSEAMVANNVEILVIDNAQNLKAQEDKEKIGGMMEYFSDLRTENPEWEMYPRVAAAGISEDADGMIRGSKSIRRRIRQVSVPKMANAQIRKILDLGFNPDFSWGAADRPSACPRLLTCG